VGVVTGRRPTARSQLVHVLIDGQHITFHEAELKIVASGHDLFP
jgi:hypothetical protein